MDVMFFPKKNESNHYISSLTEALEADGVEIQDYDSNRIFPFLIPVITEGIPDIVHIQWIHTLFVGSSVPRTLFKSLRLPLELLILRLLGVSFVWTVHNLYSHEKRYPWLERFYRVFLPNAFFDHLIVHCERVTETIRKEYRLRSTIPVTSIPHGNYIECYPKPPSQSDAQDSLGINAEHLFLFLGQIREYKQIPHLITVFEQMSHDGAKLLIAGNPATSEIEQQLRNQVSSTQRVETVLNFIPDKDLPVYFAASDTVVLPYSNILTSGSAILSMSLSRPVVAPQIGCLPGLITDGKDGFLYNTSKENGLRDAMERSMQSDCMDMGEKSYKKVSQLDWKTIAEMTHDTYQEAAFPKGKTDHHGKS